MFRKLLLLFLAHFFSAVIVQGQNFETTYTPLVSEGKLPDDFTVGASVKANKEIERLSKKKGKTAKEKIRFLTGNAFFLDNVLKSGKVLYGDPISRYVSKVLHEVIKNDPKLAGKLRVYVVKSPVVNAYTFDNGVLLVNTGLISQLENEAQLAFVLCHEVVHFQKKHSIAAHLDFIKMDKNRKTYNRNGTDLLLEKSKYSKKNEFQADAEGFEMYSRTKYDYNTIDGLFDVLQYAYLPFDEVDFDKNFFNDKHLKIPSNYYLEKVKEISANDDYNDSLSTHPNVAKRRNVIEEKLKNKDNQGRLEFIVSESDFYTVREMARFETCRLYMQQLDYAEAIYSSYILLKQYPDNLYLKKIVARSLYEVATYKNHEEYYYDYKYSDNEVVYYKKRYKSKVERFIEYADSIQGSSQQVYHLLKKLSPLETAVIALNNNWKLHQQLGYKDTYTREICDSLIYLLTTKYNITVNDFSKEAYIEKLDSSTVTGIQSKESGTSDKREASKYAKIKKKVTGKNKISKNDFTNYAFVDILNDVKFQEKFKEAQAFSKKAKRNSIKKVTSGKKSSKSKKTATVTKKANKKKADTDETDVKTETAQPDSVSIDRDEMLQMQEQIALEKRNVSEFKTLGIDKIVIMDPAYLKMDMRKKENISYVTTEARLKEFSELLEKNAKLMRLETEVLNPNEFDENDVDRYNDFSFVNDWVTERVQHGDFAKPLVLNSEFKEKLLKKFGTSHFMWTGTVNIREKKQALTTAILLSVIPYCWPYTIPYMIMPEYNTYYYAIMFNIESGKVELFNEHELKLRDTKDVLNSVIYDTFYQVKTPASTKK